MKSNRSSIASTYGSSLPRVHRPSKSGAKISPSSTTPSTAQQPRERCPPAANEIAAPHKDDDVHHDQQSTVGVAVPEDTPDRHSSGNENGSLPRIRGNQAQSPSSTVALDDVDSSPNNQPPSSARDMETPAPDISIHHNNNNSELPPIVPSSGTANSGAAGAGAAVAPKHDDSEEGGKNSDSKDKQDSTALKSSKQEEDTSTPELKSEPPTGSRPPSTRPLPATLNVDDIEQPRISPRQGQPVVTAAGAGASPGSHYGGGGRQDFSEVGSESSPPINQRWAQPAAGRGRGGGRGARGRGSATRAMAASLYGGGKALTYHTRRPPPPPVAAPKRGGIMSRSSSNHQQQFIGSAPAGGGRGGVGRVGGGARTSQPTTSRYALRLGGGRTNNNNATGSRATIPQRPSHHPLATPRGQQQQQTTKNSMLGATPPSGAKLQQQHHHFSSPGGHFQTHSSPSPARKPYEIRTTQRVDPQYQSHPLGIELKELYQTHERMMLKLRAERTQQLRMRRTLAEETKKVGTLQHAFEQLKIKKQQVIESQQKLKNVDTVQNLKAQLAVKSDELSAINAEYKRVSAPLRARDRGGIAGSGGGTSTGGAKGKLMQALEQKRLQDELQKVAKYMSTKDGLQEEISKMEALIHDYNERGLEALRDYVIPTKTTSTEDGPTTPQPRTKDEIPLVPSKMPKVVKKLQEVTELKQKLANETAAHVAMISKKLDAARRVADATEEALKSAHYIQSEQEKERSQLQSEQKSLRVAIEGHKTNVTVLTEDILTVDAAIVRLTQTVKDASTDLVEHQKRNDAKIRQDKAKEESAKQAAEKASREAAALRSEVDSQKKELQQMNDKFNKLQKQLKEVKDKNKQRAERDNLAEVKLQIETSEIESQIKSETTKLADDERKHQQKLEDAAFSSQKKSILSELQSSLETWTRKTVDMDANNNEVDDRLDRILGILRANNIEVPF